MQRELLEYKYHIAWICTCGHSNPETSIHCRECKVQRDLYPKKMNCVKCMKVLENFKKGDICPKCNRIY